MVTAHKTKPAQSLHATIEIDGVPKKKSADLLFSITPAKTARFLSLIVVLLIIADQLSLYLYYKNPHGGINNYFFERFNLGSDGNVPTLFSAGLLSLAALLLFFIYRTTRNTPAQKSGGRWLVLSCVFVFLALDEAARFHEPLIEAVRTRFPGRLPDFLYIAWVIPYAVLTLGVVAYFARFVWNLPAKTRNYFFLAGAIYVGGAMGFEMLESTVVAATGEKNLAVYRLETIEETLEMGGVILFIKALLDYINNRNLVFAIGSNR